MIRFVKDQQITLIVQARILEAYEEYIRKFVETLHFPPPIKINPHLFETPIVRTAVYGEIDPQFIDFMAPGIMVTIIFVLSIGLTALIFVIEKKEGLLERTAVANVNTLELITAHITMKLIIMIFQTVVLLVIATVLFGVNMKGSIYLAGFLIILQGFCGMSFGKIPSSLKLFFLFFFFSKSPMLIF